MLVTITPLPEKIDYKAQSVLVPGTKRPGQTGTCPSLPLAPIAFVYFAIQHTIGMVTIVL
jgi:hypothetical protein